MATEIDGVLYEWGDRIVRTKTKARPAPKNVAGKRKKAPPKPPKPMTGGRARATLDRVARRVPEVMVKVTVGKKDPATGKRGVLCKDMGAIKAHLDYISRNGDVPLENEQGHEIHGAQAVRHLRDDWQYSGGYAIPSDNGYRREAYSVVLSMPPGTDRTSVKRAARDFARENFSNHQWVFAQHDDEAHPHVHLAVRAVGRDLVRLNPRKADLQQWRELFAEKLRDHGIEANATPRDIRGRTQRAERQEVRQIVARGGSSKSRQGRAGDIARAVAQGGGVEHPAEAKVRARRAEVVQGLAVVAKALATSTEQEDRRLALAVAKHASAMPPPKTAHRLAVESQLKPAEQGRVVEKPRDRRPERSK